MLIHFTFPDAIKDGCTYCATAGSVYAADCLGCEVRHTSILPKYWRMEVYSRAKELMGEVFAEEFVAQVNLLRKERHHARGE